VGSIFGTRPNAEGKTSIGQLSLYCTETEMAKFQSWYYATLSNYYPNSVPLLFQYRLYGRTTLVVQSHSGEPFMACIVNHYN
jgi:phenylpropionate dioxygenase-like ring-hydroxylating dioxygenase large terminal subunit